MTGTREPQQDRSIQAMLRDSGLEAASKLRNSLEELRALVPDEAPAPRADLVALLAAGGYVSAADGSADASTFASARDGSAERSAATTTAAMPIAAAPDPSDESLPEGVASLAERRGRNRRLAIVGCAVVGAMALGAGAVAASSGGFREIFSHTAGTIFQPSGQAPDTAQKPARPSPADIPTAPVPSTATVAATPPPDGVPEAPESDAAVPATPGAAATPPPDGVAEAPESDAAPPPASGRSGVSPLPTHRPVSPGTPAPSSPGEDKGLPSGQTRPGVPPTRPDRP